jgi:hypothetical protein
MRSSKLLLVAILLGVVGFYPLLAPTPHRIDQEHFELIQTGMTKAEVEAIFGVPPGRYDWAEAQAEFTILMRVAAARLEQAKALSKMLNGQATADVEVRLTHAKAIVEQADAELRLLQLLAEASEIWVGRHGAFTVQFDREMRVVSTTGAQDVRIVPLWKRWRQALRER